LSSSITWFVSKLYKISRPGFGSGDEKPLSPTKAGRVFLQRAGSTRRLA
jgi:hypothetical protein